MALETSIGNVDTASGLGHAGGTQEFTGSTDRYEGATGFTYLNQHFKVDHLVTQIQGEVCRANSWAPRHLAVTGCRRDDNGGGVFDPFGKPGPEPE
ncbi:hypothetical protein [Kribbella sp. VKM Ac-2568]|uniref:hypothetical protein n=1 Tax=Kribbella sp. VKM Ac-2568 TaxID=2512219 RepID=UPI0010EB1996|nr:hypothetical protein [Kribbella sp. VKM Ac-2568]TCM43384.1 hypothetical protein EV648_1091 [Kribbella sp. VKM Ac-2568]